MCKASRIEITIQRAYSRKCIVGCSIDAQHPVTVRLGLERRLSAFAGTNADNFIDREYKDFAVSEFACLGILDDYLDGLIQHLVRHHDFDFDLWDKIDFIFTAAIGFGVPFLTTKAFNFAYGQSGDPYLL